MFQQIKVVAVAYIRYRQSIGVYRWQRAEGSRGVTVHLNNGWERRVLCTTRTVSELAALPCGTIQPHNIRCMQYRLVGFERQEARASSRRSLRNHCRISVSRR